MEKLEGYFQQHMHPQQPPPQQWKQPQQQEWQQLQPQQYQQQSPAHGYPPQGQPVYQQPPQQQQQPYPQQPYQPPEQYAPTHSPRGLGRGGSDVGFSGGQPRPGLVFGRGLSTLDGPLQPRSAAKSAYAAALAEQVGTGSSRRARFFSTFLTALRCFHPTALGFSCLPWGAYAAQVGAKKAAEAAAKASQLRASHERLSGANPHAAAFSTPRGGYRPQPPPDAQPGGYGAAPSSYGGGYAPPGGGGMAAHGRRSPHHRPHVSHASASGDPAAERRQAELAHAQDLRRQMEVRAAKPRNCETAPAASCI